MQLQLIEPSPDDEIEIRREVLNRSRIRADSSQEAPIISRKGIDQFCPDQVLRLMVSKGPQPVASAGSNQGINVRFEQFLSTWPGAWQRQDWPTQKQIFQQRALVAATQ